MRPNSATTHNAIALVFLLASAGGSVADPVAGGRPSRGIDELVGSSLCARSGSAAGCKVLAEQVAQAIIAHPSCRAIELADQSAPPVRAALAAGYEGALTYFVSRREDQAVGRLRACEAYANPEVAALLHPHSEGAEFHPEFIPGLMFGSFGGGSGSCTVVSPAHSCW